MCFAWRLVTSIIKSRALTARAHENSLINTRHLFPFTAFVSVNTWQLIACSIGIYSTSSPKGNDAHLRAIIQSEKKWKHQFFRRLMAANSVVRDRIWPNFKLIQALMYVIITCKYEKDPIKNNREIVATPFFKF